MLVNETDLMIQFVSIFLSRYMWERMKIYCRIKGFLKIESNTRDFTCSLEDTPQTGQYIGSACPNWEARLLL